MLNFQSHNVLVLIQPGPIWELPAIFLLLQKQLFLSRVMQDMNYQETIQLLAFRTQSLSFLYNRLVVRITKFQLTMLFFRFNFVDELFVVALFVDFTAVS